MNEEQLEAIKEAVQGYMEDCISGDDHTAGRGNLIEAMKALQHLVDTRPKVDITQAQFTTICLIENVCEHNPSEFSRKCIEYRDSYGWLQWREVMCLFAYNIEKVYSSHEDLMEQLQDADCGINCYDFDLVPHIADKAAEMGAIFLSCEGIEKVIQDLLGN